MDPAPRVSFDSCWDWTVEVCLKDGSFDITQENLSESRNTIDDDRKGGSFDIIQNLLWRKIWLNLKMILMITEWI